TPEDGDPEVRDGSQGRKTEREKKEREAGGNTGRERKRNRKQGNAKTSETQTQGERMTEIQGHTARPRPPEKLTQKHTAGCAGEEDGGERDQGGHSHSPPTAGGADDQQGDPGEEPSGPVPPHPEAGLRLLRPRAPRPASPGGSSCGSEAPASGFGPEKHL
ncbi:SBK3 isoform 2, partial [Pan troglodytes]